MKTVTVNIELTNELLGAIDGELRKRVTELDELYRDADAAAVMYQKNQDDLDEELETAKTALNNYCDRHCDIVLCNEDCPLLPYHKEGKES